MALDPNIALQVKPIQLPDFNVMAQQRLANVQNVMALKQQQQALQDQQAIKAAYQSALNPQTGQIDYDKLIAGVAPVKPDLVPQIQQHKAEQQLAQQKQVEFVHKEVGGQLQTALNDPSDDTLAHVRSNLIQMGADSKALDAELQPIMALPPEARHGAIFNKLAADPNTREALKFTMPDPKETNLGGTVAFIDMNPNSPTFKQTLSEKQVTMNQYQKAELGLKAQEVAISRARLGVEASNANKAPSGYRWGPGGTLVAIPGGPGDKSAQPLTDTQGKAQTFGRRMVEAHNILNNLELNGVTNTGNVKGAVNSIVGLVPFGVGEKMGDMTDNAFNTMPGVLGGPSNGQQQTEQARRDFVNAVLRRESGASISPSEFSSANKQYFPQPGDSDAVVSQKRRNRAIAIEGIRREAGPAASDIPTIAPTQPRAKGGNKVDTNNPLLRGG